MSTHPISISAIITTMNFNYAPPPPPSNKNNSNGNILLDLPTHLPNQTSLPAVPRFNQQHNAQESTPTESAPISSSLNSAKTATPKAQPKHDKPQQSTAPTFIQGTNITLQTDEDIAKWIEERKKKWPTRQNVELRALQSQESQQKRSADSSGPGGSQKRRRNICRFFQQNKTCKFGTKCKNIHETAAETAASAGPSAISNMSNNETNHYKRTINGVQVRIPKLYSKTNDISLFRNLVKRDQYEHENNLVLDFIQYLDEHKLINHDVMKEPIAEEPITEKVTHEEPNHEILN